MSEFIAVGLISEFGGNNSLKVTVAGREIALFRAGEKVYAIDNVCPHKGGLLWLGCMENGHVYCPLHGWKFDLESGHCETNPGRPVRTYEARVVEGAVQLRLTNAEGP